MSTNQELGAYGEQLASQFLEGLGFEIVDRNYRCKFGEIDIVARDEDTIVIVEVKTRSNVTFGLPAEAVTNRKVQTLRRLAAHWMSEAKQPVNAVRIDVISVVMSSDGEADIERIVGIA